MSNDQDHPYEESDSSVIEQVKVKKPKKYKVILHNDDYTTMEFVIFILKVVFHKTTDEAEGIMLEVHNKGRGVCGIYSYEVAETKSKKVEVLAKEQSHPLICTIEPE
ncbi:MAG: ATP-dependent Clp protease adapter ClpS [Bacteriovoracaceae bacterium]|jgi:ATP-dependent Clp protease adaptor protein ClpS|nr:ATP-dependent Clp protease adapter ClpS [Bacteriovoracaceae bacterium]